MCYPCFCSEKDFDQNILGHNLNSIVVVITPDTRARRLPLHPLISWVRDVRMVFILIPPPLFPAIVLVMLFSSSFLPFSAALSAAVALSSNQFLLSSLALSFTSFSFGLYSSLYRCSSPSNLAPSILSFASYPSWIFSHVVSPIRGLLSFLPSNNFLCGISESHQDLVALPLNLLYLISLQTCSSL